MLRQRRGPGVPRRFGWKLTISEYPPGDKRDICRPENWTVCAIEQHPRPTLDSESSQCTSTRVCCSRKSCRVVARHYLGMPHLAFLSARDTEALGSALRWLAFAGFMGLTTSERCCSHGLGILGAGQQQNILGLEMWGFDLANPGFGLTKSILARLSTGWFDHSG